MRVCADYEAAGALDKVMPTRIRNKSTQECALLLCIRLCSHVCAFVCAGAGAAEAVQAPAQGHRYMQGAVSPHALLRRHQLHLWPSEECC